MESIVKEFSRRNVSTPSSSDFESDPYPQTIPRMESTWLDPSSKPVFEDDRCPNPSAAPIPMNARPTMDEFAPPLNYDGSTLVDNDLDVEYTGTPLSPITFIKLTLKAHFASSHPKVSDG